MKKKIKILYIIDSLILAGAQRQLVELVLRVTKRDVEPSIISLKYSAHSYTGLLLSEGISPSYVERRHKLDLAHPVVRIASYIKKNEIDIIHSFMNMGSLFGVVAAKITSKPIVCSAIRDSKDSNWKGRLIKTILAKYADIFVSNTEAGFRSRFSKIEPHFKVIYNGIDHTKFKKLPNDSALRSKFGINDNTFVIGMVASLTENKDHETLFEAFHNILKKKPNTVLILIGDGNKKRQLQMLAEKMDIQSHVFFFGYQKDVVQFYNIMDVHVLLTNTDKIAEGFPNAVLEAMACEVPVIATDSGGTPELINHNKDGLLIPAKNVLMLTNAIEKLILNEKIRHQFTLNAKRKVIQKFNMDHYVNNYIKIYKSLKNDLIH